MSGARRVVAPVPRVGDPSSRSKWREEKLSGMGTSDQTECGEKRSPEVTASSHAQLLERKVRAEPTAGMWKGVRLSVRPVTMQLTDDRQSRDGSSRANTALG